MPQPEPATLEEFLERKKVRAEAFRQSRPQEWARLSADFDALGPAGFDQRKKFFINEWRLLFPPENG